MRRNSQNPSLNNENTSQEKLVPVTLIDDKKTNPEILNSLIERISSKISFQKKNINIENENFLKIYPSQIESNNDKSNNIAFNNYNNKSFNNDLKKRKESVISINNKRKRKGSILPLIDKNPLAFFNSIKKLDHTNTPYGKNLFKITIYESLLGVFSLASIIFAILDNEIYISKSRHFLNIKIKEIGLSFPNLDILFTLKDRKISYIENIIRTINGVISITCCIILFIKYQCHLTCGKLDKKLSEYDGLFSSRLIFGLLFECLISIIFYPPHMNIVFCGFSITNIYAISLNCIFLPFNMLKSYNVFRMLIIHSKYNSKISRTICQSYKVIGGAKFSIKSELNSRILRYLFLFFIIFSVVLSCLIRDFEHFALDKTKNLEGKRSINDLQNFINNYWLVIVSVTNVAFGDEYPRTIYGRGIIFVTSILGILSIGLGIAKLCEKLEFTSNEKEAYLKLKRVFDPENMQNKAANVIKTILLIAKNAKEKGNLFIEQSKYVKEKTILIMKIKAETKIFKNELLISRVYSIPLNDLIKTMETNLYEHLLDITNDLDKVNFIEREFTLIEKNQQIIGEKLKKITFIQDEISKILSDTHNINYLKHQNEKIIKQKEIKEKKLNIKQSKEMKLNVNVKKIFSFQNEEKKKKKENYKNNLIIRKHKNLESRLSKNLIGIEIRLNKIERSNSDKIKYKGKIGNVTPLNRNKKKKGLYSKIRKNHCSTIIELNKKVSLTLNDFDTLLPNNNFMTTFHKNLNIKNNP
jgi:hypothetical protein